MNHRFFEGEVYHKRFTPKEHKFVYPFFLLDIDLKNFDALQNRLFSKEKFNLFSFSARNHFGKNKDFLANVHNILKEFDLKATTNMRFLTLPKITGFVFNPISVLMLWDENNSLEHMLVEVHNYNGGRVLYCVKMDSLGEYTYSGSVLKDMYVSPFFKRDGMYKFVVKVKIEILSFHITLIEDGKKKLIASFKGSRKEFSEKTILQLFCKHTFLTLWVVTGTLWQSVKLYIKGIKFHSVTAQDQIWRY